MTKAEIEGPGTYEISLPSTGRNQAIVAAYEIVEAVTMRVSEYWYLLNVCSDLVRMDRREAMRCLEYAVAHVLSAISTSAGIMVREAAQPDVLAAKLVDICAEEKCDRVSLDKSWCLLLDAVYDPFGE